MKKQIMPFIEKYWFPILMIGILLYILFHSQMEINKYKKEVKGHKERIKALQEQVKEDLATIQRLGVKDTVYVDSIRVIKKETDEKIKLVDTMSVSDMQEFFTERYPAKN